MDELAHLREENAQLRERVEWLESNFLNKSLKVDPAWHLTPSEAKVLRIIAAGKDIVTRAHVMTALYDSDDEPYCKIIDIFLCRMRKKLRPFGIEIKTYWGMGWALEEEARAILKARMAA